jgi:predicted transcriptional regulator
MPAKKPAPTSKTKKGRGAGTPNLSLEKIAAILISFVLAEGTAKEIAAKHGVCERTANELKKHVPAEICRINADGNQVVNRLLLLYLTEAVTTCVTIFQDLRSPDKLKAQSFQDSLSIFGALSDRVFLLLQAAERGKQQLDQRQLEAGTVEVSGSDAA